MSLFWNRISMPSSRPASRLLCSALWSSTSAVPRTARCFSSSSHMTATTAASTTTPYSIISRFSSPMVPSMFSQYNSFHPQSILLKSTTTTIVRFKSGVKTNGGVKKRIRLRGSGSIKRWKSGKSHNTGYKKRQRVNRLGSSSGVEGKAHEKRIRKLLGCF
mmetsp:Transcript_54483/g.132234  ORF Transcript_54483/g.132234 Transcript_54483/m.132234 type:complete len:161 (-) Transcript_54483:1481-1963(-)